MNWWGGPPGPRGTPSSRPCVKNQSAATTEKPTRGPAADEGVRHHLCYCPEKGKTRGIGLQPAHGDPGLQSACRSFQMVRGREGSSSPQTE
jgi:hypothetical protein